MKVEFASLSPHEALHIAILIEQRNAHIYEGFARVFDEYMDDESRHVAAIFREMADEERRHGRELQKRYAERYGFFVASLTDEDIIDVVELPALSHQGTFEPDDFGRRQALEVALAAEHQARCYYARLSRLARDAQLRRLYTELAEFERDHEEFLQQKLSQTVD